MAVMTASVSTIKGVAIRNTTDSFKSSSIAMITAPMARNGARTTRRMSMATASWSWLTSLMRRVLKEAVPNRSSSACDSLLIWAYSSRRTSVPYPWEAFAAKYWQTSVEPKQTMLAPKIRPPIFKT